ncbi:TetR/AcrR family transcriptional regulator [Paenibacillus paridis]|uniref:TetR/AcrR family transcriptional regulator n=1 Tax=Paenibacillus paridis TaxID=2583376 RepID=UPI0011221F39|nr:TetR/AcrR family transcriptional regulator [Paenibacillus paridis]
MARPRVFDESLVLNQAMNVFWIHGYEATSLKMLLEATGLSKSSFYDSFGSKHELFLQTFRLYHKNRMDILNKYLSSVENQYQGIADFFNSNVDRAADKVALSGCLSVNEAIELAPHDEKFRELVEEDFQTVEDAFFEAIRKGKQQGSITSKDDERVLARFLVVSLHGLHVMAKAESNQQRIIDAISIVLKALL